jgi:hypothetical protein
MSNLPHRPNKKDAALAFAAIHSEACRLRCYAAGNEVSEHPSLVRLATIQKSRADRLERVEAWLKMWGLP